MQTESPFENPFLTALFRAFSKLGVQTGLVATVEAIDDAIQKYFRATQTFISAAEMAEAIAALDLDRARAEGNVDEVLVRALREILPTCAPAELNAALDAVQKIIVAALPTKPRRPLRPRTSPRWSPAPAPIPGYRGGGTEVLRDMSQLAQLVIGSSPAFSSSLAQQHAALASSLNAYRAVSAARNIDDLEIAVRTARGAALILDEEE